MVAYQQPQSAVRALRGLGCHVFADAFAVDALHAAHQRAAVLGTNGSVVNAGVQGDLHRLANQAFGTRQVQAQAHVGIFQHFGQAGQGTRNAGGPVPLPGPQRLQGVAGGVLRSRDVDDVGGGKPIGGELACEVQNGLATGTIGDQQVRGSRQCMQAFINRPARYGLRDVKHRKQSNC